MHPRPVAAAGSTSEPVSGSSVAPDDFAAPGPSGGGHASAAHVPPRISVIELLVGCHRKIPKKKTEMFWYHRVAFCP